jgi:hypothetical protein
MITPTSTWTLAMCRAAAAPIAAAHGLGVDAYIEGANGNSAVRFDLHRAGGEITCWLALDTASLEACADEAAVRDLVEREVATVVRMRSSGGAAS